MLVVEVEERLEDLLVVEVLVEEDLEALMVVDLLEEQTLVVVEVDMETLAVVE